MNQNQEIIINENNFFEVLSYDLFRVCMRYVYNQENCNEIINEVINKYEKLKNTFKNNEKISFILKKLVDDLIVLKNLDEELMNDLLKIEVYLANELRKKYNVNQCCEVKKSEIQSSNIKNIDDIKKWWLV